VKLLDHRLIVVVGKGGVGRTTTALSLGIAAAKAGKRVVVVELGGMSSLARAFGRDRSYSPQEISRGVDIVSLTPAESIDDFGKRKLRVNALVRLIFQNRIMHAFIDGVPGLPDLVQLGKMENMLMEPQSGDPVWDLCILDAPATGHGLTLLAAARSMADMTRVGPFFDLATVIEKTLSDRNKTAVVLTTLPEELPVNESLELLTELKLEGFPPAAIIVNQVRPDRLPLEPDWSEVRAEFTGSSDPDLVRLVALADRAHARQQSQVAALERLGNTGVELALLPRSEREPAAADLEAFGGHLYEQLGVNPS